MISFEENMHCKGIYSPIGECKCRCTVMTDSAITMQLTYYRGHFHRLLPSLRIGQGCQVTAEDRQAYLPVARREAEALKLQASLKDLAVWEMKKIKRSRKGCKTYLCDVHLTQGR